ncbi:hypothetical protein DFH28DRAFT_939963 [Melampsora americana]|nr:hypothetical protein DFH28DRAFT_939963 [Melampsora americana]
MTPAQTSTNPGKKHRGNSKPKASEKRANPSTPTPQPKCRPAQRQGRKEPETALNKETSHMDPGLTPVQTPDQAPEETEAADTTMQSLSNDDEDNAKAGDDSRNKTDAPEGDAHGSDMNVSETSGGEEEEDETDIQTKLKGVSFKRNPKQEGEEPMSHTQKMRAVKIQEARAQYDEVRAIHDDLAKSIKKLEERAKQGAINKSLHILKSTCNKINREMKEKEDELLLALSSDHPDVIFVPLIFDPTEPSTHPTTLDLESSPTAASHTQAIPGGAKQKRKVTSPVTSQEGKNPRKKMKASDFALDEAKECDKETAGDVSITRRSRRPPYKSPRFVDPEDMEPEGAAEAEQGETVVIAGPAKGKRKEGKKEAEGEEVELESIPELFRKAMKPDLSCKYI